MGVHVIKMPDIGEGIAEVELGAWHVEVGQMVKEDGPLADVMTDKAAVEIPSPVAGKVIALGGKVGEVLAVGSELIRLEVEGEGNLKVAAGGNAPAASGANGTPGGSGANGHHGTHAAAAANDAAVGRAQEAIAAPPSKAALNVASSGAATVTAVNSAASAPRPQGSNTPHASTAPHGSPAAAAHPPAAVR